MDLLTLRIAIRAYLSAKIPCILIGAVLNCPESKELGMHAVTVAGYSASDVSASTVPYGQVGTLLEATRIEKIYSHDDQVGPFARMEFLPCATSYLTTSWIDDSGKRGRIFFEPDILLVPLYHKIRVPVTAVVATICTLDEWVGEARRNGFVQTAHEIEWDLRLVDSSELKAEIFDDKTTHGRFRLKTLKDNLPHFIWIGAAQCAGEKLSAVTTRVRERGSRKRKRQASKGRQYQNISLGALARDGRGYGAGGQYA